jgi:hypothetical protein
VRGKNRKVIMLLTVSFFLFLILQDSISTSKAQTPVPTLTTSKLDYYPEELVTIYGSDFSPNIPIVVSVTRPDGTTTDSTQIPIEPNEPYIVTITSDPTGFTDSTGGFTATYILDGIIGDYTVNVLTPTGELLATTTFTDGYKIDSITISQQTPNPVDAGNQATYTITVIRATGPGSHGHFNVILSIELPLPTGTSAVFSPDELTFTPTDNSKAATLTIETPQNLPNNNYPVVVRAQNEASYKDYKTNSCLPGQLFVVPEYALGALMAFAACFAAFIAYKKRSSLPRLTHPI